MMTSPKVRLLLSTYRMCGCRVAGLQTSARPQQKHLSKARQKAKEDRRDGDTQWSGAAECRNSLPACKYQLLHEDVQNILKVPLSPNTISTSSWKFIYIKS